MHFASTQARQFQHFVIRDLVQFASVFDQSRIGRKNPFDIGVDFADVRFQHGRQSGCRRVAAAATQRGDIEIFVDPLKPRSDHDFAFAERLSHPVGFDFANSCLGVSRIRQDSNLIPCQADGRLAQCLNGHRHQSDGLLFASGQQHIHFTRWGNIADLFRKGDQFVRFITACADDHHDLITSPFCIHRSFCCRHNPLSIRDARTTKFLYNQCHLKIPRKVPIATRKRASSNKVATVTPQRDTHRGEPDRIANVRDGDDIRKIPVAEH